MRTLLPLLVLISSTGCGRIVRSIGGLEDPDPAAVKRAATQALACNAKDVFASEWSEVPGYEWTAIGCGRTVVCKGGWESWTCVPRTPSFMDGKNQLLPGSDGYTGIAADLGTQTGCLEEPVIWVIKEKERMGYAAFGATICGRQFACASAVSPANDVTEQTRCTETKESSERTLRKVAADRLALETGCPEKDIRVDEASAWTRGTERAFRMTACGGQYICTTAAGRTDCKAALVAPPPAPAQ